MGATTLAEGLGSLVGEPLTSVVFVHDYSQITFHRGTISLYSRVELTDAIGSIPGGGAGYRDRLCELIGRLLVSVRVDAQSVSLTFESAISLRISLALEDRSGPEAAEFRLGAGWWVA